MKSSPNLLKNKTLFTCNDKYTSFDKLNCKVLIYDVDNVCKEMGSSCGGYIITDNEYANLLGSGQILQDERDKSVFIKYLDNNNNIFNQKFYSTYNQTIFEGNPKYFPPNVNCLNEDGACRINDLSDSINICNNLDTCGGFGNSPELGSKYQLNGVNDNIYTNPNWTTYRKTELNTRDIELKEKLQRESDQLQSRFVKYENKYLNTPIPCQTRKSMHTDQTCVLPFADAVDECDKISNCVGLTTSEEWQYKGNYQLGSNAQGMNLMGDLQNWNTFMKKNVSDAFVKSTNFLNSLHKMDGYILWSTTQKPGYVTMGIFPQECSDCAIVMNKRTGIYMVFTNLSTDYVNMTREKNDEWVTYGSNSYLLSILPDKGLPTLYEQQQEKERLAREFAKQAYMNMFKKYDGYFLNYSLFGAKFYNEFPECGDCAILYSKTNNNYAIVPTLSTNYKNITKEVVGDWITYIPIITPYTFGIELMNIIPNRGSLTISQQEQEAERLRLLKEAQDRNSIFEGLRYTVVDNTQLTSSNQVDHGFSLNSLNLIQSIITSPRYYIYDKINKKYTSIPLGTSPIVKQPNNNYVSYLPPGTTINDENIKPSDCSIM